jgi:DNA-binding NtrC family response regulator
MRGAEGLGSIVGRSESMSLLYDEIGQAGPVAASVLIVGETGTGKELVARTLHDLSPRRRRAFVAVNCAAIPESLVERELFGNEKGAFTGATARASGYFEQASGGTLFLDEISAMPIAQQAKLLRALQEGSIRRIGGPEEVEVDVRVVAAMNVDPSAAIQEGKLREDLFYRLSVFTLRVPPLRERPGDVELLAEHFLRKLSKPDVRVDSKAIRVLERHHWPGNVRELRNVLEHAAIVATDSRVRVEDLPPDLLRGPRFERHRDDEILSTSDGIIPLPGMTLEELKRRLILCTLKATGYRVTEASRRLGISPRTVYNKLREWNLPARLTSSSAPSSSALAR